MNFYSLLSFLEQSYNPYYLGQLIISFFVLMVFIIVEISDQNERRELEEKKK